MAVATLRGPEVDSQFWKSCRGFRYLPYFYLESDEDVLCLPFRKPKFVPDMEVKKTFSVLFDLRSAKQIHTTQFRV
jgi:hypothetical protein